MPPAMKCCQGCSRDARWRATPPPPRKHVWKVAEGKGLCCITPLLNVFSTAVVAMDRILSCQSCKVPKRNWQAVDETVPCLILVPPNTTAGFPKQVRFHTHAFKHAYQRVLPQKSVFTSPLLYLSQPSLG